MTSKSLHPDDVCCFQESDLIERDHKGGEGSLSQDFIDEEIGRIAGFFVSPL